MHAPLDVDARSGYPEGMIRKDLSVGSLLISSLLSVSCMIMPPPQSGGSPAGGPGGGSGPAQQPGLATPSTPEAPTPPSTGTPEKTPDVKPAPPSSINVRNTCSKTVQLFIGDKPKFGSGTKTSIGGNTSTSFGRKPDGTAVIWIIDDKENGITSVTATADTKSIEIGSSCKDMSAK